jgi:signal transduction histidine kinase
VRITGRTEENYSVYCVQDNGVGIATDNIDNIFKMFYRVRPVDDGSDGLGLAIVRRIVNRHNGEVWAESEAGKGSKFFVKLPR